MTSGEFNNALAELRLSVYAAASVLQISLRQAQRYSAGTQEVSGPVANSIELLLHSIRDMKIRRKDLLRQLKWFDRPGSRMTINGRDRTASVNNEYKRQLGIIEQLLREHPIGLPSQIDTPRDV
jgi:hypothetical protein